MVRLETWLSSWVKLSREPRHCEASDNLCVLRGSEVWSAVGTASTTELQREGQADGRVAYPCLDTGSERVRDEKQLLTDRTQS